MAISKIILDGVTQIDLTQDTVATSNLISPNTAHGADGEPVVGTASSGFTITDEVNSSGITAVIIGESGSSLVTLHNVYFEFSDNTNTTITAYYNDSFISDAITATTPTTYGQKTVTLAQLDGVTWYEYDPSETWETIFNDTTSMYVDTDDWYFWIPELANVTIQLDSIWRITLDNIEYNLIGKSHYANGVGNTIVLGNPVHLGYEDDGSNVPFCFYNYNGQALCGDTNSLPTGDYSLKIERLVTS